MDEMLLLLQIKQLIYQKPNWYYVIFDYFPQIKNRTITLRISKIGNEKENQYPKANSRSLKS
jgi:hypothetical protein